jgi:hypothetical protein
MDNCPFRIGGTSRTPANKTRISYAKELLGVFFDMSHPIVM